jgi:RNase H-like domain found in reverse transcriptase
LETDHQALKYLLTDKSQIGKLARWAMKLQEFEMAVKYRKGEDNVATDFVSRLKKLLDGTLQVKMIGSVPHPETKLGKPFSSREEGDKGPRIPVQVVLNWEDQLVKHSNFDSVNNISKQMWIKKQSEDLWIQSIRKYLQHAILPENLQQARWIKENEASFVDHENLLLEYSFSVREIRNPVFGAKHTYISRNRRYS